ncbi:MAG: valine--tRNA ligase, partial [Terracidiphilus sp.]
RKNRDIPEKESVPMVVLASSIKDFGTDPNEVITENAQTVEKLAKISAITFQERRGKERDNLNWRSVGFTDIALVHEKQIDVEAEREKLAKEIAKLDSEIANGERQLDNQGFTTKAPPHIVEGLKKQLDEKRILRDKLRRDLDGLGG